MPDAWVDLEAAAEAIHRAESSVAQQDWTRAWGPALTALFVAERDFLPGEDAPWVDEIRHQLTELRLRALECYAAAGLGLDGTDSARACATSSASHPAQQPASSTSGSSPQPDAVRKPTRYSARNRQPGQCER